MSALRAVFAGIDVTGAVKAGLGQRKSYPASDTWASLFFIPIVSKPGDIVGINQEMLERRYRPVPPL